jgi:hypothetical protein
MALGAVGMVLLTGIGLHSTYAADVLPGLVVLGLGIGLVMAPAMNTATAGVRPSDAGVASAMVNTAQQVGGSIGTALLSTLATTAATSYAEAHPGQLALAAVHSYTTAFWWSAAIFAVAAIATGLLLRSGAPEHSPAGTPVLAH